MLLKVSAFALLASSVLAHFNLNVPGSRGPNHASQSYAPCGGLNDTVNPRYEFSTSGSSLGYNQTHDTSISQINFCAGDDCKTLADFDTVVYDVFEQTGAGEFCLPKLIIPGEAGTNGTIQVVTTSGTGYLYNCVDITLVDKVSASNSSCFNSSNIEIERYFIDSEFLVNQTNYTSPHSGHSSNSTSSSESVSASQATGIIISSYLTTMEHGGMLTTMYMPTTVSVGGSSASASGSESASGFESESASASASASGNSTSSSSGIAAAGSALMSTPLIALITLLFGLVA